MTRQPTEDEAAESRGHYLYISFKADRQVQPFNHLPHLLDQHPEQKAPPSLIHATLHYLRRRQCRKIHAKAQIKTTVSTQANTAQTGRRSDVMAQKKMRMKHDM